MKKYPIRLAATFAAFALCCGMAFAAVGCSSADDAEGSAASQAAQEAASETRMFTDSLGREVEIPVNVDRITPLGHTANQVLLTMAPEKLVSLSSALDEGEKFVYGDRFDDLPVTGSALGSKGDFNVEAAAATGTQLIIDTGEVKDDMAQQLDDLQASCGIPVVFIETELDDWGSAYRMLGDLLGMQDRGEELALYCENVYAEVTDVMAGIPESERVTMLYLLGDAGLNVIAKDSYQGGVIDLVANNVAVVEKATGSGLGNESNLEQIANWDPELIVFQEGSIYDTVGDDPAWKGMDAIDSGNYYEVPGTPYCWLNNPPSINQIMGLQWLPRLLYPSEFDTSIEDVTRTYYQMFYDYTLTDSEFQEIAGNALPKK